MTSNPEVRHQLEDEPCVVIMFEPARTAENLSLASQVNEVFGPFTTTEQATEWTEFMRLQIPGREWLIIPLSNPDIKNRFDVRSN